MIVSYFVWVLGTEHWYSTREIYTLDHRAISTALVVLPNEWLKGKLNGQRNNLRVLGQGRPEEARVKVWVSTDSLFPRKVLNPQWKVVYLQG